MRRIAFVLAAASILASAPAAATRATPTFTSLTVLGDSLVDAGNIFTATGGTTPSPASGYSDGRFTNGPDFTDLLSEALFGTPTKPSLQGGSNFAFGDARIVTNSDAIPDLSQQLAMLSASGQAIDPNGLYELTFGGNDVFAAAGGYTGGYGSTAAYLQAAANQYAAAIQTLNDRGVRNILVTGFPAATTAGNAAANADLNTAIAGLNLNGATTLYRYDLGAFYTNVAADPSRYGLPALDTMTSCIAANAQASGCAGYFSFDGTHPTAAVEQAAFADINAAFDLTGTVAAVPEPSVWMTMLAGVALAGALARRRVTGLRATAAA